MAIKYWLAYLLQQFAAAAAVLCAVLALSEILLPGSVLPYFNLHALILAAFALCLISPAVVETKWWTRLLVTLPLAILVITFVILMLLDGGIAAQAVMLAICGMVVLVLIALVVPNSPPLPLSLSAAPHPSPSPFEGEGSGGEVEVEDVVEIVAVIETDADDSSVFMR